MLGAVRKILGKSASYPLNKISIFRENILSNYRYLDSLESKIQIAPVLKSNAYGHGIVQVGKILDSKEAPFFCVDSLYEAYQLKNAKIQTPILIMGYVDPRNLESKKLPFSYSVFDLDFMRALDRYQKGVKVHVFVGTGMSREGVPLSQLKDFLEAVKKLKNIRIEGLMTHFASSDNPKSNLTHAQINNFQKAKEITKELALDIKWFHVGGSNAILNGLTGGANLVRSGKAIYGLGSTDKHLKTALALKSKIVQIKMINKGASVGYSETFTAKKDMKIGILPIGYNDGVDRRLSNKGVVLIENEQSSSLKKECPIIGVISMNITTIDLTAVENPHVGQEVTIFSSKREDINSIEASAKLCETLPHDLLVHLNPTTRREVV
jgi:alanine racemase